jgi:4'-phosphopantetheinyl transferase
MNSWCATSSFSMADGQARDVLWHPPPTGLKRWALAKEQVHVWRVSLDVSEDRLRELASTLSPDELTRSERLKFARDRRHFVAARGLLRALLGSYLQVDPRLLRFSYGRWGKPFLSPMPCHQDLDFNLSHSDGLALYAIARAPVGIDVERICDVDDMEQIAQRFLVPADRRYLSALPSQARREAFFALWTRYEAYAKATGEGLAVPQSGSHSSAIDAPGWRCVKWAQGPEPTWTFRELCPGPGYAAALAVQGCCRRIDCWELSLLESE